MSELAWNQTSALLEPTVRTLAIDIGGTSLKAAVVSASGAVLGVKVRVATPVGAHPDRVVAELVELVAPLPDHDRVAIGFPGMVRDGRVLTAPNLKHEAWAGYPLEIELGRRLDKPARLCNDADMQGLAVVGGKGVEMVITLGTGFGTALYEDGEPVTHLEIAHLPFRHGETFDEQLGERARNAIGTKRWNKRLRKAIALLRVLTQFDHLYVGGGNSRRVRQELPHDVTLVDNAAGIAGGARLWRRGV